MVDGIVGRSLTTRFRLIDAAGQPITGETFAVSDALRGDGQAWAGPVVTDEGGGQYATTYIPDVDGVWTVLLTGNGSGEEVLLSWDIAAALDPSLLHSAPITSAMALIKGDDYQTVDGKALIFSLENVTDLTGATVTLTIAKGNTELISQAGTVTNPGAATQTVTVELTAAQTATLPVGAQSCGYDLAAVLANGHTVTLARGRVTVTADVP